MAVDHIWWAHNLNSDIEPAQHTSAAHHINYIKPRISIRKSLARVNKYFNLNCTLYNKSCWLPHLLWLLSSWVMVIIQYSTENFIFSVDMSRLTVITFELGKHYVQCVIGFYMNYTDWAGAGPRRTRGLGAGTINNSAWSSDKYDTATSLCGDIFILRQYLVFTLQDTVTLFT